MAASLRPKPSFVSALVAAAAAHQKPAVLVLDFGDNGTSHETQQEQVERLVSSSTGRRSGPAVVIMADVPAQRNQSMGHAEILPKDPAALATVCWDIITSFRLAVARSGRPLAAERTVLHILAEAPWIDDVRQVVIQHHGRTPAAPDALRKAAWRHLTDAGQHSPSRLLWLFRVLWFVRLRKEGWSTGAIAGLFGYQSGRRLRSTLKRRCGLAIADLERITFADTLRWAAGACTRAPARRGGSPSLFRPLKGHSRVARRAM